ncbi:MAG TPA: hypothetical protein VGN86_17605 [Pyrinomonadaceae bacterium]|nr:hypothetical protein [Pyrinomonadaceae bacterium]
MKKTLSIAATALLGIILTAGCSASSETANTNANSEVAVATTTRPGPDNSEIITTRDANGVVSETRIFHNNGHVSKLVVTTKNGVRSVRVYSKNGEEKEMNSNSQNVLEETGDAIAGAAGFVADKTVEGTEKGVEVGKTVADKTKDATKTAAEKTAEGAKKVGEKTAEGAKKTGKAIKRAVTP